MTLYEAIDIANKGWVNDGSMVNKRDSSYMQAIKLIDTKAFMIEMWDGIDWIFVSRKLAFDSWYCIDYRVQLNDRWLDMGT